MEMILSDIKSVPGVTGTLVLAKESLNCFHLLPASFHAASIQEVDIYIYRILGSI